MMTASGERMLMTLAQMRLDQYERCAGPVPITITVGTICERCSFEVFRWQDHDWVHSAEEVATMRRMAAGGSWVDHDHDPNSGPGSDQCGVCGRG